MAYLALARKYRPQRFADMIGQEHVTRTLENAIRTDRVHHAYLFCGVRGLGKTTAARILAKALVCEQGPTPEPCNACSQCVAINEGRSVDVIEIDGASNNSVDDIRSLRDQVNYLPQSARRKIYIIDEVHMLTQAAFNALLKTLEEPPPHVTFMFATTDPHKVLPTILSRVSRLDYRRVRAATLVPYLEEILTKEGFAVEREGLHVIARSGEGSVRDALTLLDKVIAFANEPTQITTDEVLQVLGHAGRFAVAELVDAVLERDPEQVLARFEAMTSTGSDLMRLAVAILQHLRDLAVVKLTGGSRAALLDMSDDLFEQLQAQAARVEPTIISQHFDRFARVVDSLDNSRVPRLVIEMGLLEMSNAEPLIPLGDLVDRLDALATGAARPGPAGGGGGGGGRPRAKRAQAQRASAEAPAQANAPPPQAPAPVQARDARSPQPRPSRADQAPPSAPSPHTPAPSPERAPVEGALAPSPERAPVERAPASSPSDQAAHFEHLARSAGLLPGGPSPASTPSSSAEPRPARRAPSSAPPRPTPARASQPTPAQAQSPQPTPAQAQSPQPTPADDFALRADALPPTPSPSQRDAGCPSSRCTPREAIVWRDLDPWDAWETFIDRVREEDQLLAGVLSRVGLVSLESGTVQLATPSTGLAQTQLRENPELKTAFEHFTAVYFGEAMHLVLLDVTPSLPQIPSLELVDEQRARLHREAIEREAQSNPALRNLIQTFGGQVERIEPLAGPALPPVGERGVPKAEA